MNNLSKYILAVDFAAEKHKLQRRKGFLKIPYINHPIKVSKLLTDVGESDIDLLIAAILHDVLEDTDATPKELDKLFGNIITSIVLEVTDDMSLPEVTRKELQITKAKGLSENAKKLKIADKYCNISDLINYPINWNRERKLNYINWSMKVFEGCKGINIQLDELFTNICKQAIEKI